MKVNPKVVAAGVAGAVAAPLAVVLVWVASLFGLDVPLAVQGAFVALITGPAAVLAGYYKTA